MKRAVMMRIDSRGLNLLNAARRRHLSREIGGMQAGGKRVSLDDDFLLSLARKSDRRKMATMNWI
eukprot:scaffold11318_cov166-Skeletonema_menzelii.AAC.3